MLEKIKFLIGSPNYDCSIMNSNRVIKSNMLGKKISINSSNYGTSIMNSID